MIKITVTLKNLQVVATRIVKLNEVDQVIKFFEKAGFIVTTEKL